MKIKVGSIVKCIRSYASGASLTFEKLYEVVKLDDLYIYVNNDYDDVTWYCNDRFELDLQSNRNVCIDKILE